MSTATETEDAPDPAPLPLPTPEPAPPAAEGLEVRIARAAIAKDQGATLKTARATLEQATAAVQQLNATISPGSSHPAPRSTFREAWRAWVLATARLTLLEAVAAGETPDWGELLETTEQDATAQLLRRQASDPGAAIAIARRLEDATQADCAEFERLKGQTDANQEQAFHPVGRAQWERMAALEERIPARSRALEAFRAELTRRVAAAIAANRPALESGLLEAGAASGRYQASPQAAALEQELEGVKRQRALLGKLAAPAIASGMQAGELDAQAADLEAQIATAHADHATRVAADIRGSIDRAAEGDAGAWRDLTQVVAQHAGVFPADLFPALASLGAEAMIATYPATWKGAYTLGFTGAVVRQAQAPDQSRDF